jgi:hypothetical protein
MRAQEFAAGRRRMPTQLSFAATGAVSKKKCDEEPWSVGTTRRDTENYLCAARSRRPHRIPRQATSGANARRGLKGHWSKQSWFGWCDFFLTLCFAIQATVQTERKFVDLLGGKTSPCARLVQSSAVAKPITTARELADKNYNGAATEDRPSSGRRRSQNHSTLSSCLAEYALPTYPKHDLHKRGQNW